MRTRSCPDCDKIVKSLSGLTRHQPKCPIRTGKEARVVWDNPQADQDQHSKALYHLHEQTFDNPKEYTGGLDHNGGNGGSMEPDGPALSGHNVQGRLSTMASIRTETYEEVTGIKAGEPLPGPRYRYPDYETKTNDRQSDYPVYSPFQSSTDFALAQWLLSAGCTKRDIDRFFGNEHLAPIQKLLSFTSHDELMTRIHDIPYGIKDDAWIVRDIEVGQDTLGSPPNRYQIRYRNVVKVVEFLIGHRPFASHLVYAPVRQFSGTGNDNRIYNEMHTAEWWWRTQSKVPKGATIVPILLATDKTMLTQHHGDESAWPIYLTIGNLDRETRRKQTVPGSVLLGFLPVTSEATDDSKARVYHIAMEAILKPLESLARDGFPVICADRKVRICHPIIAGIMADYEEQVLITGIKKAQHCSICIVPPNERENLTKKWEDRTHEYTQQQIKSQGQDNMPKSDSSWVHELENFAWKHPYLNIHKAMMIDVLHQLLKGIVMNLIAWTKDLVALAIPAIRKRKGQGRTIGESSGIVLLDERFRCVPPFTGLKRFRRFSHVKQWTGVEQKAILRQIIPVLAPLLTVKEPAAMHCARAFVDFILMAQYKTHDNETLRYMEQALYRIDKMKVAFRALRPLDKSTDEGHFNFPKFHIMTHYTSFIQDFGAADNFDTEHSEAGHKYHVKNFYGRTNKMQGYEGQICLHNTRRINMLAMEDVLFHDQSRHTTQRHDQITAQVSVPAREINLTNIGWPVDLAARRRLLSYGLNTHFWRTASDLSTYIKVDGFIDALAVFVRESRNRLANITTTDALIDRSEPDPSWVADFPVALHPSLRCWRRRAKDSNDLELLTAEHVRCSPSWQGRAEWRRDYVWVQEHSPSSSSAMEGKRVGQIQVIVTVIDHSRRDPKGRAARYTGAFIELLRLKDGGRHHKVHGMVEVEDWPVVEVRNPRKLRHRCFFEMSTILRSAHIIPAGNPGTYYINHYVDWDQYNTIYDPDFFTTGIREADVIANKYR